MRRLIASARQLFGRDVSRSAGFALIIVMGVTAVLSAFAVQFLYQSRVDVHAATNKERELRAYYHARSGVEIARLYIYIKSRLIDPLTKGKNTEAWPVIKKMISLFASRKLDIYGVEIFDLGGLPGIGADQGSFEVLRIEPEDGKLNLNSFADYKAAQRTFDELWQVLLPYEKDIFHEKPREIDELVFNIIDWIDPDDAKVDVDEQRKLVITSGLGESAGYEGYQVKNAKLDTLEELLLIKGMTDELFDIVEPMVTIYPTTKVNVNTADLRLLTALVCGNLQNPDQMWPELCGTLYMGQTSPLAEAMMYLEMCRNLKKIAFSVPFAKEDNFVSFFQRLPPPLNSLVQVNAQQLKQSIKVKSEVVGIVSRGTYKGTVRDIKAILNVKTGQFYYWRVTNGF